MSVINDHILSEGVENLESETGRARFFENLQTQGLQVNRKQLDETLDSMQGREAEDTSNPESVMAVPPLTAASFCGLVETRKADDCEQMDEEWEETEEDRDRMDSWLVIPVLLTKLTKELEQLEQRKDYGPLQETNDEPTFDNSKIQIASLMTKREQIMGRVMSRERKTRHVMVSKKNYPARNKAKIDYTDGIDNEEQYNFKNYKGKLIDNPINAKLVDKKKLGFRKLTVKESLLPGDTGWGLFTERKIKKGEPFTSYEGDEVPLERLIKGYGSKDYVSQAIKNHKTMEFVCIDSKEDDSCYGRYAQDPINEELVNTKILWRKGRMVLIATTDIAPGDEIFVHYGLSYWAERLHYLDEDSRKRIEPGIKKMLAAAQEGKKTISFQEEATVAEFMRDDPAEQITEGVQEEGDITLPPAQDYRTRIENFEVVEGGEDSDIELELDQAILDELSYENVNECDELAAEIQFLNGRKFKDEGRMYEIMQVRYDPEFERIIGFRRPLSGRTPHPEDGSPFCVYGKEGLYELSERYLLHNPEERDDARWPSDNISWSTKQAEDAELNEIILAIREQGDGPIRQGRNKYALRQDDSGEENLLVRLVTHAKKGQLDQTMVPTSLKRLTLKMHHEGYGHMGANRMLETIRLRYFWRNMDQDIIEHTNKCLNCKLRKSYQRKPKVPIMKYSDTARPLDRVHVDLTGPLPATKLKNKYIMVIKDYLTKYVWLIPLKTKTAMEVAEAFVGEFICQAGVPGRVISDRGNEFVNQLLSNVSRVMGINRISTTPYNPRADGFVENHNKTLKDQLYHYVDTLKQDDWDVYLPTVQLMYNTTVSLSTGYTPMLLLTGREARMPSLNHWETSSRMLRKDVVNNAYVLKMIETMRGYHDLALSQTEKNKDRLNAKVRQPLEFVEYQEGQLFMRVRRPISQFKSADEKETWKISAKLIERYEGPYRILKVINPVLYETEIDGKVVRVHAVNMKPF
jgi:hypothetical protein